MGANGSEYTYKNAKKEDDEVKFRCIVSNSAGKTVSEEAVLEVIEKVIAPTIRKHPQQLTVKEDEEAKFSITAEGTNLSYQWLKNGKKISGENKSTLTISSAGIDDNNAEYTCVAKNSAGEVKSNTAVLSVQYGPEISDHPVDIGIKAGGTASFKVKVKNGNPQKTNFQWYQGSTKLPGETDDELVITVNKNDNGKKFSCKVSNDAGFEDESKSAELTVYYLEITKQPRDQSVEVGGKAIFKIEAKGNPSNLNFQWKKGSSNVSNTSTYSIPTVSLNDDGSKISCVVSNGKADPVTSKSVTLSVEGEPPEIRTDPSDQRIEEGKSVTFSVEADGTEPLNFQWQRNGMDINNKNAKSRKYTFTVLSGDNEAKFRCVVTNDVGNVKSEQATLTVLYKVTYNGNGATGSPPEDRLYAAGDMVHLKKPNNLTKTGYKFKGWEINSEFYETNKIFEMGSAPVTIFAQWEGEPPVIIKHPSDKKEKDNNIVTFSVTAEGNDLKYTWYMSKWPDDNTSFIKLDETSSNFEIAAFSEDDGKYFYCIVSNPFTDKGIKSNMAQLTVLYKVTYNGNGATSGLPPEDDKWYAKGESVYIKKPDDDFKKKGYIFAGWDAFGSVLEVGDYFEMIRGEVIFFAIWNHELTE